MKPVISVGLSSLFTLLSLLSFTAAAESSHKTKPLEMTVYRSPSCSCCGKWLAQMKQRGFTIKDVPTEDMDLIKQKYGVPGKFQSCHTAIVNGYVVEGHVPADDITAFLTRHPSEIGISVPGMPVGTPGMEMGTRKDSFSVIQFDKSGEATVFHDYPVQ